MVVREIPAIEVGSSFPFGLGLRRYFIITAQYGYTLEET